MKLNALVKDIFGTGIFSSRSRFVWILDTFEYLPPFDFTSQYSAVMANNTHEEFNIYIQRGRKSNMNSALVLRVHTYLWTASPAQTDLFIFLTLVSVIRRKERDFRVLGAQITEDVLYEFFYGTFFTVLLARRVRNLIPNREELKKKIRLQEEKKYLFKLHMLCVVKKI